MDYGATGMLTFAHPDSLTFLHSSLDDIVPLVGAGDTDPMPEPGTLLLSGIAVAGVLVWRRRKRRA